MAHKNVAKAGLAELAKRVPPNQALQFQDFQNKHNAYQARVNKQPAKLPKIDFEFYRINVRPDQQKWVDEFQQKYKALCDNFDARKERDYSKYYDELQNVRCEMEEEVEKFKCESEARIKELQAEYERVKALKPYEEMTLEEYCDLLPDKKMYTFEGHPSFWPHTPDEQSLVPAMKGHGHDDHGGDHGKPPKGDSGGKAAGGSTPATPAKPAPSAGGSKKKDAKAETKKTDKPTKATERPQSSSATISQHKGVEESALPQKPSGITSSVETSERKAKLDNKLIEEEIRNALIFGLLEETESKDRQAATTKK